VSRLDEAFDEPQLIGYLVGNVPDRETFLDHASAMIDAGCGVLEVGIPFSDPIADGPTIQTALTRALDAGVRPRDVLDACSQLRRRHPDVPLVTMTYANIAHRRGYDAFADRLRSAGVDGAILADVPPEAANPIRTAFDDDLAQVFLASPATSDERLDKLAAATRGFLYTVGLFGTTGAREHLDPRTVDLVERAAPIAREHGIPPAIGFGISKPEHARRLVEAGADGIVVGSAFVDRVLDGKPSASLGRLADELVDGIRTAER
jgi:tryptophan synthase alpha chain